MDTRRQVINFGPGPAKLPHSVSPSDRARAKVQSGCEHARECPCISARVAEHLRAGRWDSHSRFESPACTQFRISRRWASGNIDVGEEVRESLGGVQDLARRGVAGSSL